MNSFLLDGPPGRTAKVSGKEYLFFSGYDYLGIQQDENFTALLREGLDKYGLLFPSSRISNTRLALFETFENRLSVLTGSEATVSFASGFSAGRAAVSLFSKVAAAPGTHPAIQDKNPPAISFESWQNGLQQSVFGQTGSGAGVLAADSIDIFQPAIRDFSFLKSLPGKLTVLIDDSHGIGLIGEQGSGIAGLVPRKDSIGYLFSYSLSKAYGIPGGAVSTSRAMAEKLRQTREYTAATAISPAVMYAFLQGEALYSRQREKLRQNGLYFRKLISGIPEISHHPDLPVFVLTGKDCSSRLEQENILLSAFAYPDPSGKKIQRIVLNAQHTAEDLETLSEHLHKLFDR